MITNADSGNDNHQGAAHGKRQLTCTESAPKGRQSYQLTAAERAFQLAESGTVQSVKELKKILASEGFGMADLEGPYLARQLLNRMPRHN